METSMENFLVDTNWKRLCVGPCIKNNVESYGFNSSVDKCCTKEHNGERGGKITDNNTNGRTRKSCVAFHLGLINA